MKFRFVGQGRAKRLAAVVGAVTMVSLALVGCSSGSSGGTQSSGKFTVYLSNNFIANTWRVQMENQVVALANQPKYKNKVQVKILNASANTVSAQTADLLTAIRAKPAAIMLDASSATALNSTIQMGCKAGILMLSFDQTVTAPCAQKLSQNFTEEATDAGEWLASAIGNKGNILVDTGIPGGPSSDEMTNYWTKVFPTKHPNIHIVGTYEGQVSPGVELNQVATQVASHRDVVGVLSEGYCSSIYQAFNQAGLPAPAAGCINSNVNAIACEKYAMPCYLRTNPSWVGALGLQQIMNQLLHHKKYPTNNDIEHLTPASISTKGDVQFKHINPYAVLKSGTNYFPKLTPNLVLTTTGAGLNLTAQDALKGK